MLVTCIKTYPDYLILDKKYRVTKIENSLIIMIDEQGEGWWPISTVKEYLDFSRLDRLKAFW